MSIFESKAKESENRLRKVLISDKHFNPEYIKKVIKSDIFYLLKNYAEIQPEDLTVNIDVTKNGEYDFVIKARVNRLKIFGSLPD